MGISEISIMHHVGIVLFVLWLLSCVNRIHPVAYFISLIYLYMVHERYVMRLKRKLQYQERKQANQKRSLSDSESVRWLNHAVEKIWPICMEQIASQKILLPIIPWFLDKYKPWTAKKAIVQHMYLGRNPPMITEMRVLGQCTGDDHLVLELGMNFCTAEDMSAVIAVKLRRRLGFGMWAKLHMTAMHVEGKVLVGVKFLSHWPFLGRLRICFAEPPYFQVTVKPIFTRGLDVTELPGIAGWLDKLLSVAFEQTLVQPNMLVVDMEKFASPKPENWFSVDEQEPVAYVKVEVMEASDMKPSDLNGLADPYVKGQLGPYKFRTKVQKKTLAPKWQEEYKIPICTWESPNVLAIEVRDKDHFVDDSLGDCTININDLRDGERHDMWLPLLNIKIGRLHLAITVLEETTKVDCNLTGGDTFNKEEKEIPDSFEIGTPRRDSFSSSTTLDKSSRDNFEPVNIEGQQETGIWIHQPGSEVSQTWEPRKGKSMRLDSQASVGRGDLFGSANVPVSGPLNTESSSTDENTEGRNPMNKVHRGLRKISAVFHRGSRNEDRMGSNEDTIPSPYANIKAVNQKEIGVTLIVEDGLSGPTMVKNSKEINVSPHGSVPETPGKGNVKEKAKSILKHAEKSARSIKHALSRKGSRKSRGDSSAITELAIYPESDSSDDETHMSSPSEKIPVVSCRTSSSSCSYNDSDKIKDNDGSIEHVTDNDGQTKNVNAEGVERVDENKLSSHVTDNDGQTKNVNAEGVKRVDENKLSSLNGDDGVESLSKPQLSEEKLGGEIK